MKKKTRTLIFAMNTSACKDEPAPRGPGDEMKEMEASASASAASDRIVLEDLEDPLIERTEEDQYKDDRHDLVQAFRVGPGPSIERASAAYTWSEERPRPPPGASADATTLLVVASAVNEVDSEESARTLLAEARRKQQLAIIAAVALATTLVAVIVGASVGLTVNRPTNAVPAPAASTVPAPTASPTAPPDHLFWSTLPQYTVGAFRDKGSPQYLAMEWATEVDQVPWTEAPTDEALRLARMKQRFALATLFYATGGGDGSWNKSYGWLDTAAHECTWHRCCCGANCSLGLGHAEELG
jgi:hypothetical protein